MKRGVKVAVAGCAGLVALAIVSVLGIFAWFGMGPLGGVLLTNQMEPYALDYIAEHELLDEGEELIAYYDVTFALDGTEAAILSSERVIYHKQGRTFSIPIVEITDVRHRYETLLGDVIEIESRSGQMIKIEIAALNSGELFLRLLESAVQRARLTPSGGQKPGSGG